MHYFISLAVFAFVFIIIIFATSSISADSSQFPIWNPQHIFQFHLFQTELHSGDSKCNVQLTEQANSTLSKLTRLIQPQGQEQEKEVKIKPIFATNSHDGGSSTLMLTEFARELVRTFQLRLPHEEDDDDDTNKNNLGSDKEPHLVQIAQKLFPEPSLGAAGRFLGSSLVLYHDKENTAFFLIDMPAPRQDNSIEEYEGTTLCLSNAKSIIQLLPGLFRMHSAAPSRLAPTYKDLEIEARVTELIRLSLVDRGVGVITASSNDFKQLEAKILDAESVRRRRHEISSDPNEGRFLVTTEEELRIEQQKVKYLEQRLLDSTLAKSVDPSSVELAAQQQHQQQQIEKQLAQTRLRPDRDLQSLTGYPSGLLFGLFDRRQAKETAVEVDPILRSTDKTCFTIATQLRASASASAAASADFERIHRNCRYLKGMRQLFSKGKILAGFHSHDHRSMPVKENFRGSGWFADATWFSEKTSSTTTASSSPSASSASSSSCTSFAKYAVNVVRFNADRARELEEREFVLLDVQHTVSLLNRVLARLEVSGFPDVPKIFSAWDESIKRHTVRYVTMFIQISTLKLLSLHEHLSPVMKATTFASPSNSTSAASESTQTNEETGETAAKSEPSSPPSSVPKAPTDDVEQLRQQHHSRRDDINALAESVLFSNNDDPNFNHKYLEHFQLMPPIYPIDRALEIYGNEETADGESQGSAPSSSSSSSTTTATATIRVAPAPFTADDFANFRRDIGQQAMDMFEKFCFSDCTQDEIDEMQATIDSAFREAKDLIGDQILRYLQEYSARCVEYGATINAVRVVPIPHATFLHWARTMRVGCTRAFDEQLGRYRTMVSSKVFENRKSRLADDIEAAIARKHLQNVPAVEAFVRPIGVRTWQISHDELGFVNDNGKYAIPEARIVERCDQIKKDIAPKFVKLATVDFKNADWVVNEPNYSLWIESIQQGFARQDCQQTINDNKKLVIDMMSREVGRFLKQAQYVITAKITLPRAFVPLAQQLAAETDSIVDEFEKSVTEYDEKEKSDARYELKRLLLELRLSWSDRNTKLLAKTVEPVRKCTIEKLLADYSAAPWYLPSSFWSSWALGPSKFDTIARACYHDHVNGKLTSRTNELADLELSLVITSWRVDDPVVRELVATMDGNFLKLFVALVLLLSTIFVLVGRFRGTFGRGRR